MNCCFKLIDFIYKNAWLIIFGFLSICLPIFHIFYTEKAKKDIKNNWMRDTQIIPKENNRNTCFMDYIMAASNLFFAQFIAKYLMKAVFWFPFTIFITLLLNRLGKLSGSNNIILFITFMALLWYSAETMLLRQRSEKK